MKSFIYTILSLTLIANSVAQELVPLRFDKSRITKKSKFQNQKGTDIFDTISLPLLMTFLSLNKKWIAVSL